MRRLKMSWNTERGRLACRWIESSEKYGPFSLVDRYGFHSNQEIDRAILWGKDE